MNSTIRRRGVIAAVTAILTVVALAGCAGGSPDEGSSTDDNPYNLITPGELRVAVTGATKPFVYLDDSGSNWIGFEPDLVNYAAKVAGIKKVVFVEQDFSSLLADVAARKYDIGAAGIGYTDERAKTVNFTDGYFKGYLHFIAKPSAGISAIEDIDGKRVGTVTGTVEEDYLKTKTPKAIVVGFPDNNTAVQALLSGSIDTVFLDDGVAQDYVKQYPALADAVQVAGDGYCAWPLSKEDTALRDALNKGIAQAISSGFLKSLYDKWLPNTPIFPEYLPKQ